MFIIIPLILISISLVGILVIILRKRSYVNKLHILNNGGGNGAVLAGSNFSWRSYGGEFFPEIKILMAKMELHKHKTQWLMETEKLLRKARLISLKLDRISESLIKKVRKVHVNGKIANGNHKTEEILISNEPTLVSATQTSEKRTISPAFLKNEEERLIIEIAKSPRDSKLYVELGDLYVEMNNFNDARDSYEAAVELNPKSESLKQKLSSVLGKTNSKI